ncbi:DNA polymerase IV [Halobium salinum]|uniref:DNA polymerase IV n=1 Tax=Halobium salinum TaxID=1364940 RepID=A0ABD5P6F1_9EURY|nr:DNA polymerase IV [Halobium salinum]
MNDDRLFGAPDEAQERVVFHVDMDCFYASCERLREPTLAGKPVVVGMGYEDGENHGAVATASYEAREYGVDSAQPISQALEALPRVQDAREDPEGSIHEAGYYRTVDLEFYQEVAADVKEILHDCADTVREVSVDEAYLDVTERTAWDAVPDDPERTLAEGYARHVKQRIAREVGVPASVGVAPNMSTAKVASDHDKPDGLVVVRPGAVRSFLAPIPVDDVHGVGPVTARELASMGVETAGDLADADPRELQERFGERGREFHERARGRDDREVTPTGLPKSLSRESAFTDPTDDEERKREKVRALAGDVAERARSRGAMYRTIGIKVVTPPYDVNTRASSLPGPVDDPDLVADVALDLLAEFDEDAVRKLGVRVSKLSFDDADQSSLDGWGEARADGEGGGGAADARESSEHGAPTESTGRSESAEPTESAPTDERRPPGGGQRSLVDFD